MKLRKNKMMSYLAVTAGVGCVSSVANAAVVFYADRYGDTLQANPRGIWFGKYGFNDTLRFVINSREQEARFRIGTDGFQAAYFTRGTDLLNPSNYYVGRLGSFLDRKGQYLYGAWYGGRNYVNISFDEDDVFEAVAQFWIYGPYSYLIAIATVNAIQNPQNLSAVGGPALSISAGKAMIDAALGVNDLPAVPEPSSLGLLALGATGLLARRRRKKAA